MIYVKFYAVNDTQAIEAATAYVDEIGITHVAVVTDTGQVFSTSAEIYKGGIIFESDSWNNPKLGKVVAWVLSECPTVVADDGREYEAAQN